MQSIFEIKVKEDDIDYLGHVNYTRYISFSEQALCDWYRRAGLDWHDLTERKIGTVVVNLNISYIKEARIGEVLNIVTFPIKLGTKSFEIKQEIYNEKEELITEITKKMVMFNMETRKGIVVIDEIAKQYFRE